MRIPGKLGRIVVPIDFLAHRKNQVARTSFEPGILRPKVKRSLVTPHWLIVDVRSNSVTGGFRGLSTLRPLQKPV